METLISPQTVIYIYYPVKETADTKNMSRTGLQLKKKGERTTQMAENMWGFITKTLIIFTGGNIMQEIKVLCTQKD